MLEHPLQSRSSQGYVIVIARQLSSPPGGPDHGLELPAPLCVAVSADAGALLAPPAPRGLQLAVGVAPRLWRTGHAASAGAPRSDAASVPALPPPTVRDLLVHQGPAVVVRRASLAGRSSAGGWRLVCGRRQSPEGQAGATASGGPEHP